MRPLAVDLYCGLGGWSTGLIAEGWDVIGFDIEQHAYDGERYPGMLVLQDVRTIHGSQFKDADLIVGSSPCQEFSYRAMPWRRAKALGPPLLGIELFEAQFRIQREACEAAGRHIPMIVENVRGAQPWVGRAPWNYGSYYLWGDIPAIMPVSGIDGVKVKAFRFDGSGRSFQSASVNEHILTGRRTAPGKGARFTSRDCGVESRWFNDGPRSPDSISSSSSSSPVRKAASARIAKIPEPLARWIGRVYHPDYNR